MKKKVMSAVLAAAMVVGMAGNVVTVSAEEKYDLTLYSIDTTDPDFEDWLANVEDATGLNINVIAAPTDTDTRQQKITTMLSTGDASVDVIQINDEMSAAFKNSGWLEGLNDTVMTDDIADQFAQGYVKNMITDKDGNIIGVPGYTGYFAFWVNQEIMDEVGIKSIDTKEDFMKYMKAVSKDGRFGYGGSWEKTYAFNELARRSMTENTDAGSCGALEQIMQRQICLAQIRSTWKWYRISAARESVRSLQIPGAMFSTKHPRIKMQL